MLDDIKEKQNYLRKEILDKGLDGEEFYSYLLAFDEEKGDNLELWTIEDLEKIVKNYQQKKIEEKKIEENIKDDNINTKKQNEKEKGKIEDEKVQSPGQSFFNINEKEEENGKVINNPLEDIKDVNIEEKEEINKISYEIQNNISEINFDFDEKLQTLKVDKTELSNNQKPHVIFSVPKKHSGGLFSKGYFTYEFSTIPLKYIVIRKYSDFKWLHDIFQRIYIGNCIPPIPKNVKIEKINDYSIHKHKRALEKFIQALIDNPLIVHSPILFDFISIEDKAQFYSRQTYYSKGKIPKSLNKIITLNGNFELKFQNSDLPFLDFICEYNEQSQILFKKITTILSEINILFNNISIKMNELSSIFQNFHNLTNRFQKQENKSDLFENLKLIMSNWGEIMKNQSELLEINLREQFKFMNKQHKEMNFLIKKMNQKKIIFVKNESKLIQKKEELFKKGDVSKWGLKKEDLKDKQYIINNKELAFTKMLYKDTLQALNYKRAFVFYGNSLINEFQRIRNRNISMIEDNILLYSRSSINDINKLENILKNLICTFEKKENKI